MRKRWVYIVIALGFALLSYKRNTPKKQIHIEDYQSVLKPLQPFERDIGFAIEFFLEKDEVIQKNLEDLDGNQKAEVLAIVFPEVIRWNEFQDIIEISADKLLYVNGGSKIADFSVGSFQMKPSFVENLETYILLNEELDEIKNIVSIQKSKKENRIERIERLDNFEWQLKYAHAYWIVANHKFQNLKFQNQEERIRFFATAYNTGFMKPIKEIRNWQNKKKFPYNGKIGMQSASYSDFSIEFIKNYNKYFNN
jgi:hypothetical protein